MFSKIEGEISLCPYCKKQRSLFCQSQYTTQYGRIVPPKWRVWCQWCTRYWQFNSDPRTTGNTNPPPPSQMETRNY
jgi:hypothetical protein